MKTIKCIYDGTRIRGEGVSFIPVTSSNLHLPVNQEMWINYKGSVVYDFLVENLC